MENGRENEQQRTATDASNDGREITKVVAANNGNKSAKNANEQPERNYCARCKLSHEEVFKRRFQYLQRGKELNGHRKKQAERIQNTENLTRFQAP